MTQSLSELIAERRSRIIGDLMLSKPGLTREDAEAIYRSVTSDMCRKPLTMPAPNSKMGRQS